MGGVAGPGAGGGGAVFKLAWFLLWDYSYLISIGTRDEATRPPPCLSFLK